VFVRIWLFRPKAGLEHEFEALYGETGPWTQLFQLGHGYRGTALERVALDPPEYRTIDRWESRAAWEAFRREFAAPYESLDRRAERVTDMEQLVEEADAPAPDK
jgi:heme-degrading monooxygenase HmoA